MTPAASPLDGCLTRCCARDMWKCRVAMRVSCTPCLVVRYPCQGIKHRSHHGRHCYCLIYTLPSGFLFCSKAWLLFSRVLCFNGAPMLAAFGSLYFCCRFKEFLPRIPVSLRICCLGAMPWTGALLGTMTAACLKCISYARICLIMLTSRRTSSYNWYGRRRAQRRHGSTPPRIENSISCRSQANT